MSNTESSINMQCDKMSKACICEVSEKEKNKNKEKEYPKSQ